MVSGSYSVENHRGRDLGRGLAPPRKKINSNYDNILFLALGTENSNSHADADI